MQPCPAAGLCYSRRSFLSELGRKVLIHRSSGSQAQIVAGQFQPAAASRHGDAGAGPPVSAPQPAVQYAARIESGLLSPVTSPARRVSAYAAIAALTAPERGPSHPGALVNERV